MKKMMLALMVVAVVGCAYGGDQIRTWIEDPHYIEYQNKLTALERSYLSGEIAYAEYLEQKRDIDNQYTWEVQKREEIFKE